MHYQTHHLLHTIISLWIQNLSFGHACFFRKINRHINDDLLDMNRHILVLFTGKLSLLSLDLLLGGVSSTGSDMPFGEFDKLRI